MLPEDIKGELPSIEDIEQKLDEEIEQHKNPTQDRLKAVKERLRNLRTDEIKTTATFQVLQDLFQNGLKPLYQNVIIKMRNEFSDEFISIGTGWTFNNMVVHDLNKLETLWQDENGFQSNQRLDFFCKFDGFKKSGAQSYNHYFSLLLVWDNFSYSLKLDNYSASDIWKKLYHQSITEHDIRSVTDMLLNNVLDKVDWMIEQIDQK
jgi:hypothetical protein